MRASTAGNSTSVGGSRKVNQKIQELGATLALQQAMELFERRMEGLCLDMEVAADSSVVIGRVLEQWPQMFKVLNLIMDSQQLLAERIDESTLENNPVGETLVRFSVEDLQVMTDSDARPISR